MTILASDRFSQFLTLALLMAASLNLLKGWTV